MPIKGVDVSRWQGVIDWTRVKTDFAIMKATQGVSWVDPMLERNRTEARKQGILCGFYHFADGGDAVKEAKHFLDTVGELQGGELIVLDWEIAHANPVTWCKTFLDACYKMTGIRPLLYTNSARLYAYDWSPVVNANFGLWVAQYNMNVCTTVGRQPRIGQWPFYAIWQYCSRGSVPGISGNIDMNYSKMDIATLRKYGQPEIQCTHCCPAHCH